jgi:hypothetical protein
MELDSFQGRLAQRWPFVVLVVIFASLMLALETRHPRVSLFWLSAFRYLSGACWAVALRARLARLGLPHSSWVLIPLMLFVLLACIRLPQLFSLKPLFGAGLFVLLHLPLVILKNRPPERDLGKPNPA